MGRVLGIDWGERRVGVALSDTRGVFARPFSTLSNDQDLIQKIKQICLSENIEKIVVGLPVRTDGKVGRLEKLVRKFAERLEREIGIEVILWDERFSSAAASYYMSSIREIDSRKIKDKVEASIILQGYLESVRS